MSRTVVFTPKGVVGDLQVGDETFTGVTLVGDWEGLMKFEYDGAVMIAGKGESTPDFFSSLFSAQHLRSIFEDVKLTPIRLHGKFNTAWKGETE